MERVLVLSRVPAAGRVKTRLAATASLTLEDAAMLARAMLLDTLLLARRWPLVFAYHPPGDRAIARRLVSEAGVETSRVLLVPQRGAGLGERMENAVADARDGPCDLAVLGSGTPHLGEEGVAGIFAALRSAGVVVGPTRAGGVYALGLRNGIFLGLAGVFADGANCGPEGPDSEIDRLRGVVEARGLGLGLLPESFDVEDQESLEELEKHASSAGNNALTFTRPALRASRLSSRPERASPPAGLPGSGPPWARGSLRGRLSP